MYHDSLFVNRDTSAENAACQAVRKRSRQTRTSFTSAGVGADRGAVGSQDGIDLGSQIAKKKNAWVPIGGDLSALTNTHFTGRRSQNALFLFFLGIT